jgi:hypothetical protein
MLHISVFWTFGLASPVVGFTIMIALLNEYVIRRLCIGKLLLSTHRQQSDDRDILFPIQSQLEKDVYESWTGLYANISIVLTTIILFWTFLYFDMIADWYGNSAAFSVCGVFLGFSGLILWLVWNYADRNIAFTSKIQNIVQKLSVYSPYKDVGLSEFSDHELGAKLLFQENVENEDVIISLMGKEVDEDMNDI